MFDKENNKDFNVMVEVDPKLDINNYSLTVSRGDKIFEIICNFDNGNYLGFNSDKCIRMLNDNGGWVNLIDNRKLFPYKGHEDIYCTYYGSDSNKLKFIKAFLQAALNYIRKCYPIETDETKVSKIDFKEIVKSLKKLKFNNRLVSEYINEIYYSNHNNSLIVTFTVFTKEDIDKLQKKLLSNKYKDHIVDILTNNDSDTEFAFIYE